MKPATAGYVTTNDAKTKKSRWYYEQFLLVKSWCYKEQFFIN